MGEIRDFCMRLGGVKPFPQMCAAFLHVPNRHAGVQPHTLNPMSLLPDARHFACAGEAGSGPVPCARGRGAGKEPAGACVQRAFGQQERLDWAGFWAPAR